MPLTSCVAYVRMDLAEVARHAEVRTTHAPNLPGAMRESREIPEDIIAELDKQGADLVRRAWRVAVSAHEGQVRKDGSQVICHVVGVTRNVCRFAGHDADLVAAALLHDVVENTEMRLRDLQSRFGVRIASLVDAVTNRAGEDAAASAQRAYEAGEEALLLRLCDRLDGIRRSAGRSPERRRRFLVTSRQVHLPLAEEHFPALAAEMQQALEEAEGTLD